MKASTEVRNGIPYQEILKIQEEKGLDLIVIASHGRSAVTTYLMGNVTSRVLKVAKCQVLLVK